MTLIKRITTSLFLSFGLFSVITQSLKASTAPEEDNCLAYYIACLIFSGGSVLCSIQYLLCEIFG